MMCWIVYGLEYDLSMFYFFKQKTAYEMRISDWSSDVCSSDLGNHLPLHVCVLASHLAVHPYRPSRPEAAILVILENTSGTGWLLLTIAHARNEIGRASCRESVCRYV